MNYPVWQLDFAGGGLLIATIAIFHVYISHFAIGGGLFLVLTEMKAYREDSQDILAFTRRHTKFFLLLTMVLGTISGVGIWFTISLINPAATSTLIHNFVFFWAIEWVFFLAEIVALLVYYYTFEKMPRRQHLKIGWLYFIFAWLSLFVINGILTFMLTPGDWLETRNIWDGFFNPSFWPSLFFRTFLALMLAGLFGFLSAVSIKDISLRKNMVRYCALWLLTPFYFFLASAYWYIYTLPEPTRELIFNRMPEVLPFLRAFAYLTPVIFTGGLIMAIRMPVKIKKPLAVLLLVIGISYMGSFEFIRESSRRPYIIYDHTYSNAIPVAQADKVSQAGILKSARWVKNREISNENELAAGEEIFTLLCLSCHSINGPLNDIIEQTAKFTPVGLEARLSALGRLDHSMPPFLGTNAERRALTAFIMTRLQHRKPELTSKLFIPASPVVPPFNTYSSDYVLLLWTDQGIRSITDADAQWSFRPPGSNLYALLIKRGETPELVSKDVTLTYLVDPIHGRPSKQIDFWKHSTTLTGLTLPEDTGLSGQRPIGFLRTTDRGPVFSVESLPIVPYTDNGFYQPYPMVTVTALSTDGHLLATAKTTLPVSTELGCRTCHGGPWKKEGLAGIAEETALGILEAHDKLSHTNLTDQAAAGKPVLCQSCHNHKTEQLNLSAAMHGFHAPMLMGIGAKACNTCHASSPDGATRFFRGIHNSLELDCTNCHGTMTEHAVSLLKAERAAGKKEADLLLNSLLQDEATLAAVLPRIPWEQEPDCLNCHVGFSQPDEDTTFNQWTANKEALFSHRTDDTGIPCAACHGAPHAIYPTVNPYGKNRDNLIPIQYQGTPYPVAANRQCRVCHRQDMAEEIHHPNSLGMFRNTR